MVAFRGRGGRGNRGKHNRGGHPQCTYCKKPGHTQEKCYALHGYLDNVAHVAKSEKSKSKFFDEEYQDYLRLKSNSQAHSSSGPSVSTTCISQSMDGQNPWLIDSGASDHISGNSFLFSSIFPPKFPHLVTLANGSKVASQGIGQVLLSSSLKLNSILYIPNCPYNLISLSQLTHSLNCSITFNVDSFIIQERGTGCLIGAGHESRGLYYLKSNSFVSCFAASSPKLLHDRLGHPSLTKLKIMVPSLSNFRS